MPSQPLNNISAATVRNDTLILHFENAETPMVARLDLDSLAQATFEVQQQDGAYFLRLRDTTDQSQSQGQNQTFGKFATKADAHQALHAILQALLAQQSGNGSCGTRSGCCGSNKKCGGWMRRLGKIFLFLLIAFLLFYFGLLNGVQVGRKFAQAPGSMMLAPQKAPAAAEAPQKAPKAEPVAEAPQATTDTSANTVPEGEAIDADSLLGITAPPATPAP